jgi:hypothetical protein
MRNEAFRYALFSKAAFSSAVASMAASLPSFV